MKYKKSIILLIIFISILFFMVYYFNLNYLLLKATDYNHNKVLFSRLVKKGDSFRLLFQNSISKTFAEEVYIILDHNKILLDEFRYQSCDAGFPLGIEYDFSIEDDFMVIRGINKLFSKIDNIRIAINYPHYFLLGDFKYNLTEKAPGHILEVKTKRIIF